MADVVIVGEGPNDDAVLRVFIQANTRRDSKFTFSKWKDIRLNRGHGFKRKLVFAIKTAIADDARAIVAVVDADKNAANRKQQLSEGRETHRRDVAIANFPIAIGVAIPEIEAWLLDDIEALKLALGLAHNQKVSSPTAVPDAKKLMSELIGKGSVEGTFSELYASVASNVSLARCRDPKASGLKDFVDDVRAELAHL